MFAPLSHPLTRLVSTLFELQGKEDSTSSYVVAAHECSPKTPFAKVKKTRIKCKFPSTAKWQSKMSNFFCVFDKNIIDFLYENIRRENDKKLIIQAASDKLIEALKKKFTKGTPELPAIHRNLIEIFCDCIEYDVKSGHASLGFCDLSATPEIVNFERLNNGIAGSCTFLACRFFNFYKFSAYSIAGGIDPKYKPNTLNRMYTDTMLFGCDSIDRHIIDTYERVMHGVSHQLIDAQVTLQSNYDRALEDLETVERVEKHRRFPSCDEDLDAEWTDSLEAATDVARGNALLALNEIQENNVKIEEISTMRLIKDSTIIRSFTFHAVNRVKLYDCANFSFLEIQKFTSLPHHICRGVAEEFGYKGTTPESSPVAPGLSCHYDKSALASNLKRFVFFAKSIFTLLNTKDSDIALKLLIRIYEKIKALYHHGWLTIQGQETLIYAPLEPLLVFLLRARNVCKELTSCGKTVKWLSMQYGESFIKSLQDIAKDSEIDSFCLCQSDHIAQLILGKKIFAEGESISFMGGHIHPTDKEIGTRMPVRLSPGVDHLTAERDFLVVTSKERDCPNGVVVFKNEVTEDDKRIDNFSKSVFPQCFNQRFYSYLASIVKELFKSEDSKFFSGTSELIFPKAATRNVLGQECFVDRRVFRLMHDHTLGCHDESCFFIGHTIDVTVVIAQVKLDNKTSYPLIVTAFPNDRVWQYSDCVKIFKDFKSFFESLPVSSDFNSQKETLAAYFHDILNAPEEALPAVVREFCDQFAQIKMLLSDSDVSKKDIAAHVDAIQVLMERVEKEIADQAAIDGI